MRKYYRLSDNSPARLFFLFSLKLYDMKNDDCHFPLFPPFFRTVRTRKTERSPPLRRTRLLFFFSPPARRVVLFTAVYGDVPSALPHRQSGLGCSAAIEARVICLMDDLDQTYVYDCGEFQETGRSALCGFIRSLRSSGYQLAV